MINKLIKFFQKIWASCACECHSDCQDNCKKDKCVCGCVKKAEKAKKQKVENKSLKE